MTIELIDTSSSTSGDDPGAEPSGWDDAPAVGNAVIRLDEKPSAAEIKYLMLDSLSRHGSIRLDASSVTKISMPVVQVILAAHKQIAAQGGRIIVQNANFFFLSAFERLGYLGSNEIFQLEYA
jgi:anti-anti-sigma regulatory factor